MKEGGGDRSSSRWEGPSTSQLLRPVSAVLLFHKGVRLHRLVFSVLTCAQELHPPSHCLPLTRATCSSPSPAPRPAPPLLQGFVHCDLKPENVLLKEANNRRGFTAKVGHAGNTQQHACIMGAVRVPAGASALPPPTQGHRTRGRRQQASGAPTGCKWPPWPLDPVTVCTFCTRLPSLLAPLPRSQRRSPSRPLGPCPHRPGAVGGLRPQRTALRGRAGGGRPGRHRDARGAGERAAQTGAGRAGGPAGGWHRRRCGRDTDGFGQSRVP